LLVGRSCVLAWLPAELELNLWLFSRGACASDDKWVALREETDGNKLGVAPRAIQELFSRASEDDSELYSVVSNSLLFRPLLLRTVSNPLARLGKVTGK
jgi:hypothetical protein